MNVRLFYKFVTTSVHFWLKWQLIWRRFQQSSSILCDHIEIPWTPTFSKMLVPGPAVAGQGQSHNVPSWIPAPIGLGSVLESGIWDLGSGIGALAWPWLAVASSNHRVSPYISEN
jgi:hypothetical protein